MKNCKTCQQIYDNNSRRISYLQEAYDNGLKEAYDDGYVEGVESVKENIIKHFEGLPESGIVQDIIKKIEEI